MKKNNNFIVLFALSCFGCLSASKPASNPSSAQEIIALSKAEDAKVVMDLICYNYPKDNCEGLIRSVEASISHINSDAERFCAYKNMARTFGMFYELYMHKDGTSIPGIGLELVVLAENASDRAGALCVCN